MTTYFVCHGFYSCETGCCGHRLCLDDEGDEVVSGTRFSFAHPSSRQSAQAFAEEEWPNVFDGTVEALPGKWYRTITEC